MYNLGQRMNINHRKINNKSILIYEDHRTILNILCHAYKNNLLDNDNPPNLICFDRHDDGKDPTPSAMGKIKKFREEIPDIKEFFSFIDWELSSNDDDWLKVALELGFINDAIVIGVDEKVNFNNGVNLYEDHVKQKHSIWLIGHLWAELGHQGKLSDVCQKEKFKDLWDIINWRYNNSMFGFENKKAYNLIIDFDLDCFTTFVNGFTMAWPQDFIYNSFNRESNSRFTKSWNAQRFLKELISFSKFVTIAQESECTGSKKESELILEIIDEVIWNNKLLKRG